jgi:hypothetical protein
MMHINIEAKKNLNAKEIIALNDENNFLTREPYNQVKSKDM